jgi:hypothetical protein
MSQWDNLKPVEEMNYCKADLKTGMPLIVADLLNGTKKNTSHWRWEGYEKDGVTPCAFDCEYIEGKKDKSGARAKLRKFA